MKSRLLLISFLLLAGCSAHDAERARNETRWLRTELFFSVGPLTESSDRLAENEKRWQHFLDTEVTPRFPDGLSVYDVYGQWRSAGKTEIIHEHSKSLMVIYRDSSRSRADIEAIRAAWKKETGEESVLRVTQPADVAF